MAFIVAEGDFEIILFEIFINMLSFNILSLNSSREAGNIREFSSERSEYLRSTKKNYKQ